MLALLLTGCNKIDEIGIIGGADGPTAVLVVQELIFPLVPIILTVIIAVIVIVIVIKNRKK
ncbi:MAG: hypothetical protein A2Y17_11805 [Clostridiales bacterium GWF2_38_85]|nr:MAG: hypothetical protein A2Y17_11805 [Clostridiales bacterium GWF2_38_85]HBL85387.1 hypothetical protein [Clostridiales bacterium]